MSNLKKYIKQRVIVVSIALALVFIYCSLINTSDQGSGFFRFSACEWSYLVVVFYSFFIGIIDLIVLALKQRLTWAKFFFFILIEALLIVGLFISDYINH